MSGPFWQPPCLAQYRIRTQKALSREFQMINRLVGICHTIYHPRVLLFLLILLLSLPRMQKDSPGQSLKFKFCLSCKVKCHSMELSLASVWKSASPPTTPHALRAFDEHLSSVWSPFCLVSWLVPIKVSTL